jgi:DNA-binding YbaB/EbfC family protein
MSSRIPKDMRQLMQQAQQMQEGLKKAQEEMASKSYTGTAGGGVVTATVTGSGELLSVEIEPDVLDPDDADMVGDLVVAAVNQARRAAETEAATAMGGLTGGLDLGGLLG